MKNVSSITIDITLFLALVTTSIGCGRLTKEESLISRTKTGQLQSEGANPSEVNPSDGGVVRNIQGNQNNVSDTGGSGSGGGDNGGVKTKVDTPYICQNITRNSLKIPRDCCLLGNRSVMINTCAQFDLNQCSITTCE